MFTYDLQQLVHIIIFFFPSREKNRKLTVKQNQQFKNTTNVCENSFKKDLKEKKDGKSHQTKNIVFFSQCIVYSSCLTCK